MTPTSPHRGVDPVLQRQSYTFEHPTRTLSQSNFWLFVHIHRSASSPEAGCDLRRSKDCGCIRVAVTTRGEICVNVTTVIKYLLPGSATTDTSVLGPETLRSTALLLSVLVTVAPWWSIGTTLTIALRSASWGWSRWADGLFVGRGDNFSWEMQPNRTYRRQITKTVDHREGVPFAEVFDTLGSNSVVVVLPRELGLDETLGGQTLEGLDNFEVRNVQIIMFRKVVVLLGNQNSLCSKLSVPKRLARRRIDQARRRTLEEVFVDDAAVLF